MSAAPTNPEIQSLIETLKSDARLFAANARREGALGFPELDGAAGNMSEAATALQSLMEERDAAERNRDMWKGQCERQAAHLTEMRSALNGMCMMLVARPDMARQMGFAENATFEKARAVLNGNQPDQGSTFVRQE